MIATRRRILAVLALLVAVAAIGLVAYVRRASTATPASVETAPPARLLPTRAPAFPLKVGPTGRYLVDRNGRPFLVVGDSPQGLIADLSAGQAARFIADRQRAGFNAIWVNLLCDTYTGGRADGTTYDGIAPFRKPGNLSTPNAAYFTRADSMIQIAARHHVAVFLDPIETGGWLGVLKRNGVARAYAYGRYLGRRFRHDQNIVWLNGNDFQTWRQPPDDALVLAVARGIKAADPDALQTVELNYLTSTSSDDPRWRSLIGIDSAYTYGPTYAEVLKAYERPHHRPVVMIEASYEGEHDYVGPSTLRREEYWTMLSGATGQFYGDKYTWQFLDGWKRHFDTIGTRQLTFLVNLFSRRRWFDLVPDTRHQLVVSGYGTDSDSGDLNDSDHVSAARTADGSLAIAYLPTGQPITVDMRRLTASRVLGQWYDPTSGRYTAVPGSLTARGRRRFVVPGPNHEGGRDWVLVLSARSGGGRQ